MLKFLLLSMFILSSVIVTGSVYAQEESILPEWVRNIFVWYTNDEVSEEELLNAIGYLVNEGIILIPNFGECGENTELVDGQCISTIVCGQGIILKDNVCERIKIDPIIQKSGYHSFEGDSPLFDFSKNNSYFYLERFEDKEIQVPGVTPNAGKIWQSTDGNTDSVDEDDGEIDGIGQQGHSFNLGEKYNFLIFTFDKNKLKELPTHVGIVVTDSTYGLKGPTLSQILFSIVDEEGNVVHSELIEHLDFGESGTANKDVFFGAIYENGIKEIRLAIDYGSMEVDHLQYGR